MDSEMVTYLIVGIVLGIIIGVILTNVMSPKSRNLKRVKRELDETKQELANQKQIIVKHFSHSAEILDNMAKEFRRLYQHMAENSSHLISDCDIDSVLIKNPLQHDEKTPELTTPVSPPRDYSGNPSGLLSGQDSEKQH